MARLLVIAFVLAIAATAAADPYAEGQVLYANKDYLHAAEKFEAAYTGSQDPAILFNIAQAYRLGRACALAARFYHRYLEAVPEPANRERLDDYIREMDACAQREAAVAPEKVVHDTRVVHDVTFVDRTRGRRRAVAVGIGSVGIVGLAVGAYFSYDLRHIQRDREGICGTGCMWADVSAAAAQLDHRGRRAEIGEAVAYGVGGVALVAGIALYVASRDTETPIAAIPVSGGAMLVGAWRF